MHSFLRSFCLYYIPCISNPAFTIERKLSTTNWLNSLLISHFMPTTLAIEQKFLSWCCMSSNHRIWLSQFLSIRPCSKAKLGTRHGLARRLEGSKFIAVYCSRMNHYSHAPSSIFNSADYMSCLIEGNDNTTDFGIMSGGC